MEIDMNEYSKEIQELRKKKYTVRPIRRDSGWLGPEHDSAFMNDGSAIQYTVPSKPKGRVLVDALPDFKLNDLKAFANELGLEDTKDLNPNARKGFWKREAESTVRMDKNGKYLVLSDTRDFVEFLVLRSNSHLIAGSWATRFDSGEFKFAMVEEGEELIDSVSNLEEKKRAYRELDKIDGSAEKMKDFLYVYYLNKKEATRPPRDANVSWLKNSLGSIIENDLMMFLEILEDKDYSLKLLIQRSVETGALIKTRHNYSLPGADSPIGVIEEVIDFLDDVKNQSVRMKLMHQVQEPAKI